MHGNVWEWCSDCYGDYPKGAVSDPVAPREGSFRVRRGGCWCGGAAGCRSAVRDRDDPSDRDGRIGFRVALSYPSEIPK
jgi:formylglycine-generating enzyme required for sulfatase activity